MNSKKINQLATELTPSLSDLTIIGDPSTGISKKITLSQMASLFTGTVEEYANLASFPLVGVADTIYIALDTNIIYRWNTGTSAYVELSPNIVTSLVFSDANGFDGTISLVGSTATLTITTALTTGSVPFIGASGALSQDNANLFFDDTNNRLGINTNVPTTALDVFGSGIIGRLNGTSTNNAYLGFSSAGTNKWSIGNVQSDHRFRIYNEATTSELVSVLSTGEFGIGIANPTTKFHIDGAASALIANLDANVSVAKSISFRSDNSNRINLEVSGTESGSNAGADFFLRTYTDAGALLETPFSIVRSTGITTIKSLTLTNALSVANGGTGITSLTAGRIPFGNGSSALNSSANLFWDNTNSRLGIGTNTPNYQVELGGTDPKLSIASSLSTGISEIYFSRNTSTIMGYIGVGVNSTVTANGDEIVIQNSLSAGNIIFRTNSSGTIAERIRIASTGSIGIGTTPPTTTNFANFFVGRNISMFSGSSTDIYIGSNFYYDGGFKVRYSEASAMINTNAGDIIFQNSSSGTAGGTFNGVERMRISNSGNVGIGGVSSNYTLDVNKTVAANFVARILNESSTGYGLYVQTNDNSKPAIRIANSSGTATIDIKAQSSQVAISNGGTAQEASFRATMSWPDGYRAALYLNNTHTGGAEYYIVSTNNSDGIWGGGKLAISGNNGGNGVYLNGITATTWTGQSDIRLKDIDSEIENAIDKVNKLRGVRFTWKSDETKKMQVGLIAQEVKEVLPEAVDFDETNEDYRMGVQYTDLIPLLINAIKEQQIQIEELKVKIK